MLHLSEYINKQFTVNGTISNKLLVFDIDDTLINTTAKIGVRINNKLVKKLSNDEFNEYVLKPNEEFDFSEFNNEHILFNETFTKYWDTLKREYKKGTHIAIITARSDAKLIKKYFLKHGVDIKTELIAAVKDPKSGLKGNIQQRKAMTIKKFIELGYKTFVFFDDNENNLKEVKRLENIYKNIKIITIKA